MVSQIECHIVVAVEETARDVIACLSETIHNFCAVVMEHEVRLDVEHLIVLENRHWLKRKALTSP